MKKYEYTGKTYEEAKSNAIEELNLAEENLIIETIEEKNTLLKHSTTIEVITYNDVIDYLKEVINEITKLMGLDSNLEVRRKDNTITIKIFSDHNAVLIGKNGYTISALQTIVRQIMYNEVKDKISVILDVENYKEKKIKNIEYIAKKTAREVAKTKVEAKLDCMNS